MGFAIGYVLGQFLAYQQTKRAIEVAENCLRMAEDCQPVWPGSEIPNSEMERVTEGGGG